MPARSTSSAMLAVLFFAVLGPGGGCGPGMALAQQAGPFTIAGTIADAETSAPIAFARVILDPPDEKGSSSFQVIKTGADGRFSFTARAAGMYSLSAQYRGVTQRFGQPGPGLGFGVGILAGPGRETTGLMFRWFRASSISGTVADQDGEPVGRAALQLIRVNVSRGKRVLASAGYATSDERGRYRFGALAGGAYFVVVTASSPASSAFASGFTPTPQNSQTGALPAYLPAYFPGPPVPGAARAGSDLKDGALALLPGEDRRLDFTLTQVPGVTLTVKHPSTTGGASTGRLMLIPEHLAELANLQTNDWAYGNATILRGVPPGRYLIRYFSQDPKSPLHIEQRISLASPQESVELTLPARATISGLVEFPAGKLPQRAFSLNLRDARNLFYLNLKVPVQGDTPGKIPPDDMPPGDYTVAALSGEGYTVRDLKVSGAAYDTRTGIVSIGEGANVQLLVQASNETGSLAGVVVDAAGNPLAGKLVVLRRPGLSAEFQTDSDGTFEFYRVPAGEYVLFALPIFDFRYADPGILRADLAGTAVTGAAVRAIRVATGQHAEVGKLPVAKLEDLAPPQTQEKR